MNPKLKARMEEAADKSWPPLHPVCAIIKKLCEVVLYGFWLMFIIAMFWIAGFRLYIFIGEL